MEKDRKGSEKSFPCALGPGCREFESRHSDQKPESAIAGSGFFFVYGIKNILPVQIPQVISEPQSVFYVKM